MSHDAPQPPAHCAEATAPYATTAAPSTATLLERIERAGPAALDDHELLGLVGIDVDLATLAAAGGLRELLDDPDDTLRTFLLPAEDRARVHALHELHARWMEAGLRRDGALTSPARNRVVHRATEPQRAAQRSWRCNLPGRSKPHRRRKRVVSQLLRGLHTVRLRDRMQTRPCILQRTPGRNAAWRPGEKHVGGRTALRLRPIDAGRPLQPRRPVVRQPLNERNRRTHRDIACRAALQPPARPNRPVCERRRRNPPRSRIALGQRQDLAIPDEFVSSQASLA